eukprot:TRINITY_DN8044_c0_g1_i1.p1 TRINITY_DN8044_c0_g1~~TRINITY_DN8044_c0_g1_i1.p1  ORF type:complete len:102 (+),score=30.40 TRINITY_DN8044_c0_g1_i1:5-310(+)
MLQQIDSAARQHQAARQSIKETSDSLFSLYADQRQQLQQLHETLADWIRTLSGVNAQAAIDSIGQLASSTLHDVATSGPSTVPSSTDTNINNSTPLVAATS